MHRLTAVVGVLVAAFLQSSVTAQVKELSSGVFLRPDLQYSRTVLVLRDGTTIAGFYTGFAGDSVRLLSRGKDLAVPLPGIREFEIETEPDPGKGALLGSVLGAYVGTILVGSAERQPLGYMDAKAGYFPYSLLFAIPGLLFFTVGTWSGSENFSMDGSDDDIAEETGYLKDFLLGTPPPRKFHITVQGGWMSQRLSAIPEGVIRFAPYPYPNSIGYPVSALEKRTNLNLFRKIQFTVSLRPWLEAGVAILRFSEPGVSGYVVTGRTDTRLSFLGYVESFKATAYTLVGSVEPFWKYVPAAVKWKAGAGIGFANVNLNSTRTPGAHNRIYQGYGRYSWEQTEGPAVDEGFTGTPVVLTLFTTLEIHPYSLMSIGFAADYTFCPGKKYPAVPEWNLSGHTLGNANFGFVFGIHF